MDVSIVIVNYNTSALLKDSLLSTFEKTTGLLYEIIVVDNASSDDSVVMLRRDFPQIRLIESKENLGFGRANNVGAQVATGNYLFLLNTDTLLINNAIKILFDFMEEHQDVGACGGNLYKADMKPNFSYSLYFPTLFSIFCYRSRLSFLLNNEYFNDTGKAKDVAIIIGAGLFLRKKVFDALKGFDPSFFMYVEDGDLCYRISKINFRVVSNPGAKIIHLQGASSSTVFKYTMEVAGYSIYFKNHSSSFTCRMYKIIEFANVVSKIACFMLTFNRTKAVEYFSLLKIFRG